MPRPKLLIVDDDPVLVRAMTMALTSLDRYDIHSVTDPVQALDAVLKLKPDLVVLDWMMPKMNGGAVASQIRSHPIVGATRMLILSSAIASQKVRDQLKGIPAIPKPVGMLQFVAAIEAQIRDAGS